MADKAVIHRVNGELSKFRSFPDRVFGRLLCALRAPMILKIFIPSLVALTSIVWLAGNSNFLFGEDSLPFAGAFSFNFDPFIQYSYTHSFDFPVPDQAPYFYILSYFVLLTSIQIPIATIEKSFIFLLVLTCTFGISRLVSVIGTLNGVEPRFVAIAGGVVSLFYVMNPFSLTIIWWHFENWTLFYAFLPFFVALLLEIVYSERLSPLSITGTVALAIILGPGVNGAFAVGIVYGLFIAALALAPQWARQKISLKRLVRRETLLLLFGGAILAWSFLPFVVIPHSDYTANGYVTSANLPTVFEYQSRTTQLLPVSRFLAFNWLTNTPDAYPWIAYLSLISAASIVIASLIPAALLAKVHRKALLFLTVLAIPVIIASTGSNSPFGWLNTALLRLGGPFLVLVNGYYLLGEILVVAVSAAMFYVLISIRDLWTAGGSTSLPPPSPLHPRYCGSRRRELRRRIAHAARDIKSSPKRILACLAALVLLGAIVAFSVPFDLGTVYQENGPNIDSFQIPSDFSELRSFFQLNYTQPNYFVAVFPMSSDGALYMKINGQGFQDTGPLLASYIPYPIIWAANSNMTVALEDSLAGGDLHWLGPLLASAHIRYIVVNPYADQTDYYMTHAPNGNVLNWTQIFIELSEDFGPPVRVGSFALYDVTSTLPIVYAEANPSAAVEPTYADYARFLGSLNDSSGPQEDLAMNALWTSTTSLSGPNYLTPVVVNDTVGSTIVPVKDTFFIINASGKTSAPGNLSQSTSGDGWAYNKTANQVEAGPTSLFSLTNTSQYTTNLNSSGPGLVNHVGDVGNVAIDSSFDAGTFASIILQVQSLAPQNWIDLVYSLGILDVTCEIYVSPGTGVYNLGTYASVNGSRFAWDNVGLKSIQNGGSLTLGVWFNGTSLNATISTSDSSRTVWNDLRWGGLSDVESNQGFNTSNSPKIYPNASSQASMSFIVHYTGVLVSGFDVLFPSPVESIVLAYDLAPPLLLDSQTTFDQLGNVRITVEVPPGVEKYYVILGYPASTLWTGEGELVSEAPISWAPLDNVFTQSAQPASGPSVDTISLTFNVYTTDGLFASWIELATILTLMTWLVIRRTRHWISL